MVNNDWSFLTKLNYNKTQKSCPLENSNKYNKIWGMFLTFGWLQLNRECPHVIMFVCFLTNVLQQWTVPTHRLVLNRIMLLVYILAFLLQYLTSLLNLLTHLLLVMACLLSIQRLILLTLACHVNTLLTCKFCTACINLTVWTEEFAGYCVTTSLWYCFLWSP